jgi:hypothetical protein
MTLVGFNFRAATFADQVGRAAKVAGGAASS